MRRWFLAAVLLVATALPASAQTDRPLHDFASKLFLTAAMADVGSTGYAALRSPYSRETNPMYAWMMPSQADVLAGRNAGPAREIALMATIATVDVATAYAVQRWIAPRHPKLTKVAFIAAAGVRFFAAARNVYRVESAPAEWKR